MCSKVHLIDEEGRGPPIQEEVDKACSELLLLRATERVEVRQVEGKFFLGCQVFSILAAVNIVVIYDVKALSKVSHRHWEKCHDKVVCRVDATEAVLEVEEPARAPENRSLVDTPDTKVVNLLPEISPMPEQQPPQVSKLNDRIISKRRSLVPFLPHDADADVGLLNHGDVVDAISDC